MRIRLAWALLLVSCNPAAPASPARVTLEVAPAPSPWPAVATGARPPARVAPTDVDTSRLSERERAAYDEELSDLLAPCVDTPVTLGACLREHRACAACAPAARFLVQQVASGKAKNDREAAFHARFDEDRLKTIALDDSPSKGPADAAETIVVWADFECPMCAAFEPMLEEVQRRAPRDVRVVFKHYPISHHAHAKAAAAAAIAAGNQGKFWEMAKKLFAGQSALEQADLERYATELGLDVKRLRSDMTARRTIETIERDQKQADDLGLLGTPYAFFNGRELDLGSLGGDAVADMMGWVAVDLELAQRGGAAMPRPEGGRGAGTR